MKEHVYGDPSVVDKPLGKLNYWGYTSGYYFAPKASYAAGKNPVLEFKGLVKALHKEGLEVIVELFFTERSRPLSFLMWSASGRMNSMWTGSIWWERCPWISLAGTLI